MGELEALEAINYMLLGIVALYGSIFAWVVIGAFLDDRAYKKSCKEFKVTTALWITLRKILGDK